MRAVDVDVDVDGRPVSPGALLQLPVAAHQIRIAYTALSLSIPERGRLRYWLEGVDQGWQDAGTRREAIYTNRRPGHYRFRVLAANQDGGWNERGAAMEIQIPPPFCLTSWFLALSALVVAGLLWLIYLRRLRVMETRLQARLAERHIKRERIARAARIGATLAFRNGVATTTDVELQVPGNIAYRPAVAGWRRWFGRKTR
nr:triple tyrosine motif-containing protein [Xanthomonas oryzae]